MRRDQESHELRVGVFVFAGLVALGIVITLLGAKTDLFSPQYTLYAEFSEVNGLKAGAPVRLAGLDVGLVDSIRFPDKAGEKMLRVRLSVRTAVRDKIRADSKAEIATQGVLGDKYISLTLGSTGDPLKNGAGIESVPPTNYADLVETAGQSMENIRSISAKIDALMTPGAGKDAAKGVTSIAQSVAGITHEIESGNGLLHRLIYDKETAGTLDDVKSAAGNVSALTAEARNGKGIVPALLNDPKQRETLDKLSATADSLQRTSLKLEAIVGKIDRGEGTVGALINDPGVYDDLRALLGRAKRNRILRTVIRHQIDKNETLPKAPGSDEPDGKKP